jgi:hydrogenase maturation protein HypF
VNDVESFITDAAPAVAARAAVRVRVRGVVQGVGFRPFVYRLARDCGLVGWVRNDALGVLIHAEGPPQRVTRFREALVRAAPAAASVRDVIAAPASPRAFDAFRILPSPKEAVRAAAARVPPDRAACPACLREVLDPLDRRHGYPLTTCTECGPRYSLIVQMPYDRATTGMREFAMCPAC